MSQSSHSARIGIFPGSFDPVHAGHLAFGVAAARRFRLSKVFFMTEQRPRRKQGVRAHEHRNRMVQLAVRHYPRLASISLGQQRFTATETLPVLHERFKGTTLYLLLGDDEIGHLAHWPHVEELLKDVRLVIGLKQLTRDQAHQRLIALQAARHVRFEIRFIETSLPGLSSRNIRMTYRHNRPAPGIPREVDQYITEQMLYAAQFKDSRSRP